MSYREGIKVIIHNVINNNNDKLFKTSVVVYSY